MKFQWLPILLTLVYHSASSQISSKCQLITGMDLYQWYKNPKCNEAAATRSSSSGTSILAFPLGARFITGVNNFSLSFEASANIGLFSVDINEFKGVGSLAFPLIIKFNQGGLSGFSKNKLLGYSIGGGIQYSRTELFGLTSSFNYLTRDFFPTYVGEISIGGGVNGASVVFNNRIGIGPKNSFTLNSGIIIYMNFHKNMKNKSNAITRT